MLQRAAAPRVQRQGEARQPAQQGHQGVQGQYFLYLVSDNQPAQQGHQGVQGQYFLYLVSDNQPAQQGHQGVQGQYFFSIWCRDSLCCFVAIRPLEIFQALNDSKLLKVSRHFV